MRISQVTPTAVAEINTQRRNAPDTDFSFTLNRLSDEGLADRLHGLIDDITVHGKRLAEHMDIKDMRHYRGLISDFIGEVVTHAHEFTRENYLDRRGRHRVYGLIKQVDADLDELARELVSAEEEHIDILDKVDEIKGLLLDMIA
jgi:uncharacterized protein YaaR (DUF327 family)